MGEVDGRTYGEFVVGAPPRERDCLFRFSVSSPGKPEKFKGEHLQTLSKPTLILQGERDTFGTQTECQQFEFSSMVRLAFLPDGDHSFKPRKSSGYTEAGNVQLAIEQLCAFIKGVDDEK